MPDLDPVRRVLQRVVEAGEDMLPTGPDGHRNKFVLIPRELVEEAQRLLQDTA